MEESEGKREGEKRGERRGNNESETVIVKSFSPGARGCPGNVVAAETEEGVKYDLNCRELIGE